MTAIASYYASVGVGIDPKSLQNVQRYLDTIQAKMVKFQKDAFKTSNLSLRLNNFTVSRTALRNTINSAVANQRVRLDNVTVGNIKVSGPSVAKQINAAISTNTKGAPRSYNVGVDLKTFRVDSGALSRAINNALRTTSTDPKTAIRLRNFHASQKDVVAAINKALNVHGSTSRIRIGALLSQSSLTGMRNQIRQAINQLVVNPTINPRVRVARTGVVPGQGAGGSGGGGTRPNRYTTRDPRSMNPWHNPMMIGGATGAFMRYGMFSLPFVAGAYGLNALSKNMETLQNAEMAVMAQVGDRDLAQKELDFLYKLGRVHGVKMTDMAPGYSQMYAAAQGTVLGDKMQESFQSFLQYASVIGMNEDQKKGAILALSQIVGKGGKNFAQELNLQLVNQGMPNARRLFADAVAGGDLEKFEGMMQRGEVGMEGVVKFLALLGERAQPFMEDFYKTITRTKGVLSSVSEEWLKNFQKVGGATEGMTVIYRAFSQTLEDSLPFAQRLGDLFRRAGHIIAAGIVVPQEFIDWLNGEEKQGNFMALLFGPSGESGFAQAVQYTFKQVENFVTASMEASRKSVEGLKNEFSVLNDIIAPLLEGIGELLELGAAYQRGGISGLAEKNMQIESRGRARDIAEQEALDVYQRTGVKVPRADVTSRADEIYRDIEYDRLNKPEERSWWQRYQFGAMRTDKEIGLVDPGERIADWIVERIKGWFAPPEVNPSPVSYSEGTRLGQTSPHLETPMSSVETVRRMIENMQPVPENEPFSTPYINQITPEVRITISGGITVDGELGTMIDDTNLSEKFNEQIEQMLYGTRPQFSVVHR